MRTFAIAAALALASCGQSVEQGFIGDRIPDTCGANWPVCDTYAGCRLDNSTYISGKLPGEAKFIVHTQGPANIEISMLVTNALAEGTLTRISIFQTACSGYGGTGPISVDGKTFFAESQTESGTPFVRSADVSEGGDHLVDITSDATADYLLEVTVTEMNPSPM